MPATIRQRSAASRTQHRDLIALRINAGLSREALGYHTGVSRETIRLAEDGFVPTPRVQFALAQAFDRLPLDLWPIHHQKGVRR